MQRGRSPLRKGYGDFPITLRVGGREKKSSNSADSALAGGHLATLLTSKSARSWGAGRVRPRSSAIQRSRRDRYEALVRSSPLLPSVLEYIKDARTLELRLGVASSSDRVWVEGHLAERGLLGLFHCVVTRDDVDNIKPDPDLYVAALNRLRRSPDRAVAIEDSLNGVVAAKRAGMICVAVPNQMTMDMSLEKADLRLGALSDMGLETLLASLTRPVQGV